MLERRLRLERIKSAEKCRERWEGSENLGNNSNSNKTSGDATKTSQKGDTHPMGENSPGEATGTGQKEMIDSLKPPLARSYDTRYDTHLADNT